MLRLRCSTGNAGWQEISIIIRFFSERYIGPTSQFTAVTRTNIVLREYNPSEFDAAIYVLTSEPIRDSLARYRNGKSWEWIRVM